MTNFLLQNRAKWCTIDSAHHRAPISARGEAGYRSGFRFQRPGVRIPPGGPKKESADRKVGTLFFVRWDSNPERVSDVKKTVRWTVFSREVRRGCAARTQDARRSRCGCIPPGGPKKRVSPSVTLSFFIRTDIRAPRNACVSQVLRAETTTSSNSTQNRGSNPFVDCTLFLSARV